MHTENSKANSLTNIAYPRRPSTQPLRSLSKTLAAWSGPCPVFEVQCAYAKAWKHLPENVKAGTGTSEEQALLARVEQQVKSCYTSILDLLPTSTTPAITDSASQSHLTHETLSTLVKNFRLPYQTQGNCKPKVALALANGPLLGIAILATTSHYTCCPLAHASGAEQFRSDLTQSGASVVLVDARDVQRFGLDHPWVKEASIQVVTVRLNSNMTLDMYYLDNGVDLKKTAHAYPPNTADDIALILFTSGTSGTKKTVPITLHALISGVAFVIDSWGLGADDICLNMMPLFHVGGIVRNLFAPILAGGSTVCCTHFDPNTFWDIVEDQAPTWYYASPSMHQLILDTSKYRHDALSKSKIRAIFNAAGGLLPSLAQRLKETFGCVVLPSYGMTECMPISSPPLGYKLDRPGTSGITVGPDLAILDGNDNFVPAGRVGRIAVRGVPVFSGYLESDGSLNKSEFTKSGFFNTGDMGYLDCDGYLFITGRSKEVINRGGELISPFEVEEAVQSAAHRSGSPIEGRITAVLAFSMPHNVLQETVGLMVVTPPGKPRVCIKTVQEAVKISLSPVKWPQVIVFSDDLPKNNNKLLRIKLGHRMGMEDLSDDVLLADRHFEVICCPPNTPLNLKMPAQPHRYNPEAVKSAFASMLGPDLEIHVRPSNSCGYPEVVIASVNDLNSGGCAPDFKGTQAVRELLDDSHIPVAYHWLTTSLPRNENGRLDHDALDRMISKATQCLAESSFSIIEEKIAQLFVQVLGCSVSSLDQDSNFFDLGGDSIRAGRFLSELRRVFNARIPVDLLFTNGTISSLAGYIDRTGSISESRHLSTGFSESEKVVEKTCSSTNPLLLVVQLLPILFIYPAKRALTWTVFLYMLAETLSWPTANYLFGRLFSLILSLAVGRLVTYSLSPLFGIAAKWIIIGRYRPGLYPMWGLYHTRWWLVDKILSICGRGHFGKTNWGRIAYLRLLGAKIGQGVTISGSATLGEYDLLDIGPDVNLDNCICRPFAVEKNTAMYLGPIRIGEGCSVGIKAVIAPGSTIPKNTCIGPNSSSYELGDADESNRNLSTSKAPAVNAFLVMLLAALPQAFIGIARATPWACGIIGLVYIGPKTSTDRIASVLGWFAEPYRIGFHYFALILHAFLGPMFWFAAVLVVKLLINTTLGKYQTGPVESKTCKQLLRANLLKKIISQHQFHKLADIFGAHYETTSSLYRLLGARVGRHVYWPGTGPSVQNIELLDVGDNVVFGSRSIIMSSDGYGSETVKIGSGSMISDRVVLAPGTVIAEGTVFGTGALSKRDKYYSENTVWVGSRAGEAVCLSAPSSATGSIVSTSVKGSDSDSEKSRKLSFDGESGLEKSTSQECRSWAVGSTKTATTSPFGRAFYEKKAPYHVYGLSTIVLYSSFITMFTAFFWNVGATSSVQIIARLLPVMNMDPTSAARPFVLYALFTGFISVLQSLLAILALATTIASKWVLLGRRSPGNYDWDKKDYCQRWQLYLTIERLRRNCYSGDGILGLLTGTHWMVLYFRALGASIGKDCALFAGGKPSCMFTEPDLLTLGDRVSIDDASLVCHINSRGIFDLNPLKVGSGSVLRSGSRLLSGAKMGANSVLLEHTLVMAGDEVREGTARQGWPSEEYEGLRMPSLAAVTAEGKA